tara:strand:- start:6637 stop:7233 length:597 start_codon:yes stop_codon:yes gene_type:complete
MCWGSSGGDGGAAERRAAEEARAQRVRDSRGAVDTVFDTYDDDFYNKRRQSYLDYANPQVQQDYEDAMGELMGALASSGRTKSSLAAKRKAKGQELMDRAQADVNMKAEGHVGDLKSALAQTKQNMYDQASTLADVDATTNLAIGQFQAASKPPVYNPLTDMFADVTAGLATQADLERRNQARFNTGLFTTGDRSRNV